MEATAAAIIDLRGRPDRGSLFVEARAKDSDAIFALLERGVIEVRIGLQEQQNNLRSLLHRYRDRRMSLADACLVRLSELNPDSKVFTLDSDFRSYRKFKNKVIPVLMPD